MSWALKIGSNDYLTAGINFTRGTVEVESTFKPNLGVINALWGLRSTNYDGFGIIVGTGGQLGFRIKVATQGAADYTLWSSIYIPEEFVTVITTVAFTDPVSVTFEYEGVSDTVASTLKITNSEWTNFNAVTIGGLIRGVSNWHYGNGIQVQEMILTRWSNPSTHWSADASNHSGSTNQPILTEIINSKDATGVNFPSYDASVWVNLGEDALSIVLDTISSTLLMHSPKVLKDQKIALNTITSTTNVSQPKVLKDKKVDLDSLVNALTIYQPAIFKDKKITLSTIDSTVTIEEPKVLRAHTISLNNINSSVSVEEPKVLKAKSVKLGTLNNFSFVHQPKLTGGLVIEIGSVSFRLQIQWQGLERL